MDFEKFANGSLARLIREGIREVVDNISDERTPAHARRALNIKITFRPAGDRKNIKVGIETQIDKAPINSAEVNMFLGQDLNGDPVFYSTDEQIPGQLTFNGKVVE